MYPLQGSLRAAAPTRNGPPNQGWPRHPTTAGSSPVRLAAPIHHTGHAPIRLSPHTVLKAPNSAVVPDLSVTMSLQARVSSRNASNPREAGPWIRSLQGQDWTTLSPTRDPGPVTPLRAPLHTQPPIRRFTLVALRGFPNVSPFWTLHTQMKLCRASFLRSRQNLTSLHTDSLGNYYPIPVTTTLGATQQVFLKHRHCLVLLRNSWGAGYKLSRVLHSTALERKAAYSGEGLPTAAAVIRMEVSGLRPTHTKGKDPWGRASPARREAGTGCWKVRHQPK